MRVVQEIHGFTVLGIKRLIRMVYKSMDTTSRSIAVVNLRRILKWRTDVMWLEIRMKAPVMGDQNVKREMNRV